jgi:hypothetical protein
MRIRSLVANVTPSITEESANAVDNVSFIVVVARTLGFAFNPLLVASTYALVAASWGPDGSAIPDNVQLPAAAPVNVNTEVVATTFASVVDPL